MAAKDYRKTLTPEEVRRRLDRATNVISVGAGSLLGHSSSLFTDDDTERSLIRLLAARREVKK